MTSIAEIAYRTPDDTLREALNYDGAAASKRVGAGASEDENGVPRDNGFLTRLRRLLGLINDSTYIYPSVSVFVVTIFTVVALFHRQSSILLKILAVLVLVAFVLYTVYQFQRKGTI